MWQAFVYADHGGRSFMIKPLLAAFIGLLVCPAFGQVPVQIPTRPSTLAEIWTLDATYNDQQNAVEFRYPKSWEAATEFGFVPPALSSLNGIKPTAGFGYREVPFPRDRMVSTYTGTNLEGVGLVYSALPAASVTECERKAATLSDSPKHSTAVFRGRPVSMYETGDVAMRQNSSGTL
jgi:hypothetical protein